MLGPVVYTDQERVVNNLILLKELHVLLHDLDQLCPITRSHFEGLLSLQEIEILQRDSPVVPRGIASLYCLSPVGRALQIIPYIYYMRRVEQIVHNAEVDFLADVPDLSMEDDLVDAEDLRY